MSLLQNARNQTVAAAARLRTGAYAVAQGAMAVKSCFHVAAKRQVATWPGSRRADVAPLRRTSPAFPTGGRGSTRAGGVVQETRLSRSAAGGRRRGFTLVEAVLALAILSIGIFVLIECIARCLAVIRTSRNYQTARMVLDQGEMDHPLVWTNDVDKNAVSEVYPNGYTFSRELTPMDGEESLYLVKTRVAWSETGKGSFEEVISVIYSPQEDVLP